MGRRHNVWRPWLIATALLFVLSGGLWFGVRGPDNLHAVTEGTVYRSAQMSDATLARTIEDKGIKSIMNLRGEKPDSRWFQKEMAVARAHGVLHLEHKLSALEEVPTGELEEILAVMDRAPKPLLVHCEGGSDRTGLVAAAWGLLP